MYASINIFVNNIALCLKKVSMQLLDYRTDHDLQYIVLAVPPFIHSLLSIDISFFVLFVSGEALGMSNVVPVPYDKIMKDPGTLVVLGLPDGIHFQKPSEYNLKNLMLILEHSHQIRFKLQR